MIGPSHRVRGANCSRFTNTWSPISSVFSIELEGISKACTMNVIMNRPVTSTAARDARNSTVVSRGFSTCVFSFLATRFCPVSGRCPPLVDYSKCAVPACQLEQMADCVGEMIKSITRGGRSWHFVLDTAHRPIDQQGTPNDVFPGNEAPVAAIEALIAIITEHEIMPFGNYQFAVLD